ncbi:MAG: dipeptidase [Planctomycetota bacterium]
MSSRIPVISIFSLLTTWWAAAQAPETEQEPLQKAHAREARALHERLVTLDTHVDIEGPTYATEKLDPGIENPELRCDLVKMSKGHMDGVFLAVYVGQPRDGLNAAGYARAYERARALFDAIRRLPRMHPDRCELVTSVGELSPVLERGHHAIMIGVENGYPIGEDLSRLAEFHGLGARYVTLCHSRHNQVCDSSSQEKPLHNGLSDFGKTVVAEMNRLGIMIDVSHISEKSFWDVIATSKAPAIASHSGCAAVHAHDRNLTDEQLRGLAKVNGVIQIVSVASFLKKEAPEHRDAVLKLRQELQLPSWREISDMSEEERNALRPKVAAYERRRAEIERAIPGATLADMIAHLEHAIQVAGIDHVGIGSDFDGGGGVAGFANHAEAGNITLELARRGYSEEEIGKIWGGNLLRVWRQVEKVASELQAQGHEKKEQGEH